MFKLMLLVREHQTNYNTLSHMCGFGPVNPLLIIFFPHIYTCTHMHMYTRNNLMNIVYVADISVGHAIKTTRDSIKHSSKRTV